MAAQFSFDASIGLARPHLQRAIGLIRQAANSDGRHDGIGPELMAMHRH
jgi:hypothetical protein